MREEDISGLFFFHNLWEGNIPEAAQVKTKSIENSREKCLCRFYLPVCGVTFEGHVQHCVRIDGVGDVPCVICSM